MAVVVVVMAVTAGRTTGSDQPPDATEQFENWLAVEESEGGTRSSFVVPVGGWFYYGPGEVHLENRAAVYFTGKELCSKTQEIQVKRRKVSLASRRGLA